MPVKTIRGCHSKWRCRTETNLTVILVCVKHLRQRYAFQTKCSVFSLCCLSVLYCVLFTLIRIRTTLLIPKEIIHCVMPGIIQNTKCGHLRYVRMKIRSGRYPFHPLAELDLTYATGMKPADRANKKRCTSTRHANSVRGRCNDQ